MNTSNGVLQAAAKTMKRLSDALRSGGRPLAGVGEQDAASTAQAMESYVDTIFRALAAFRFFSLSMGVTAKAP